MSEAESNRAAFPETAKLVDELRAVFGPDVKLVWASEGGREIGKRFADGVPVTRAADEITRGAKIYGR